MLNLSVSYQRKRHVSPTFSNGLYFICMKGILNFYGFRHDVNLQYEDEAEAYNKFKSHGYFTPHPNAGQCSRQSFVSVFVFQMSCFKS